MTPEEINAKFPDKPECVDVCVDKRGVHITRTFPLPITQITVSPEGGIRIMDMLCEKHGVQAVSLRHIEILKSILNDL